MIDFSKLFHQSSKDHTQGGLYPPKDFSEWPEEWKKFYYKDYPRLQKITLPKTSLNADFYTLIKNRKSERDFSKNPATIEQLSTLLQYSCGITHNSKGMQSRAQPSGGARFPLEVYPIVFRDSSDVPSGLYHYNVREHALDSLWRRSFSEEEIGELFTYPWARSASFALVITGVFYRTQMKYGERGYRYILIEAGHIGQNVYLNAGALGLKCCALAGTQDQNLEKLLDIDGVSESVVYALALG
jgi:SagB-type dehydrogenase family enzyme